jgi:hypothetical protein
VQQGAAASKEEGWGEVLHGTSELQRFKNEEGRPEERNKGQGRMIPREGGRGVGMKGERPAACQPGAAQGSS